VFLGLLSGSLTRDEADRWASQWVAADDPPVGHPAIWTALDRLYGIDLTHGGPDDYLHPLDQIREWLDEFRATAPDAPEPREG
jgi:hypothetical protein